MTSKKNPKPLGAKASPKGVDSRLRQVEQKAIAPTTRVGEGGDTDGKWGGLWREKVLLLRERMLFILERWEAGRGRYDYYESMTGIPASRWQNLCLEKQLPTVDMVMAIAMRFPFVAEWLIAAGTADERALDQLGGISGWNTFQNERAVVKEYRSLMKRKRDQS